MERDGSGVSALLGLYGFVVRTQLLVESTGEWWLAVETLEDRARCARSGVRATGRGRRRVVVRDLPITDRPVVLVWAKRLWRCAEPACPAPTWSEECDEIGPRAVLTERARAEICRRVGPGEHSVAQAARDFGVSWHTAMAAGRDHGQPRVDHLARLGAPSVIGLDEPSCPGGYHAAPDAAGDRDRRLGFGTARRCSACSPRHCGDRLAGVEAVAVVGRNQPCGDRSLRALRHRCGHRVPGCPPDRGPLPCYPPRQRGARRGPPPDPARQPRAPGHTSDPLYRIRRRLLAGHERPAMDRSINGGQNIREYYRVTAHGSSVNTVLE
jgi:hypothetical protein